MSAERHQEHESRHAEHHADLAEERERRLETLSSHQPENSSETSEKRAEAAREVINHQEHAPEPSSHETAPRRHMPQLLNPKLNYQQTLASVQRRLKPLSRSFSKLIHTPAIERTSDAIGNTVARPSVALGSTWTALIVGTAFYFTARRYGYTLSGSELIISFAVGALLGLVLEGAWRAARRR